MPYNLFKPMYDTVGNAVGKAYSATGTGLEKLVEISVKGLGKLDPIVSKGLDGLAKFYKVAPSKKYSLEQFMKLTEKKLGELDSQSRALVTTFYLAGTGYAGWGIHSIAEGNLFEGGFLTGFGLVLYGAGVMQHKIGYNTNLIHKALDERYKTSISQQNAESNINSTQ